MAEQNFYVTKSGNDGNDGSSWADGDAWLTIQHAADTANPVGGTPTIVHVAAGTYVEQINIDTYAGTDDDNRIIFDGDVENESGDGATRPIIDGGSSRSYGFKGTAKSYIDIRDFEIINCLTSGIYNLSSCTYWRFIRGHSHSNIYGIKFDNASAVNSYSEIYNSIIYDNDVGIWLNKQEYVKIYNNVVSLNTVGSLQCGILLTNAPNLTEKNNIIHDNGNYQIRVNDDASKTGFVSDFNDLYRDTGTYVGQWGTSGSYTTLADWQTASSEDANSIEEDPLYVNEAGKDFHITDNASPCYQTGTDLSGTFTDDYDKDTRVHWDIGADYIPTLAVGLAKMVQIM